MTLYGLSAIRADIEDERSIVSRGTCDWPVQNPFGGDLTCARDGFGYYIKTCAQHRKKFMAQLISELVTNPDAECSLAIAEWMRGALSDYEPDWWGERERLDQAAARKAANTVLGFLAESADFDTLPPAIRARIDRRLNDLIDERLQERWSA